jgi:cold shock CspA family protein
MTETITKTGRVRKIITERGYGFIDPDDSTASLFFHRTSCDAFDRLLERDPVSYTEELDAPKGPRASNVVPLSPA